MRSLTGLPIGIFKEQPMPLGGGGFVIAFDQARDGSYMAVGADVSVGYIRTSTANKWSLLLRRNNLPAGHFDPVPSGPNFDNGTAALRISRSNPNRLLITWAGHTYLSDDRGATLNVMAGLTGKCAYGNTGGQRRFCSFAMDIHPTNPNIILWGSYRDPTDVTREGVYLTTDGGTNWNKVLGLPRPALQGDGSPGRYLVRFDHNDASKVYIHVPGSGVWRSTTGAAVASGTFTLVTGGPAHTSCMVVNSGNLWLTSWRNGGTGPTPDIFKLTTNTWTTYDASIGGADQFDINPNNSSEIAAMMENGGITISRDGGTTWEHQVYNGVVASRGSGETAWISNSTLGMYPANLRYDATVANKIWVTDGVGVSWAMIPAVGQPLIWHDMSSGNEELIVNSIRAFPTIKEPFVLCWDKPLWKMKDLNAWNNTFTYPTAPGVSADVNAVTIGYDVDQSINDPNFLAMVCGQGGVFNGWSGNAGESFTVFDKTKYPAEVLAGNEAAGGTPGGAIAVSNKNNIIILPSNNGTGHYTKNFDPANLAAVTWNTIKLDGVTPTAKWANAYYVNRKNISADKARPGVFACVYTVILFDNIDLVSTANIALTGGTNFPTIDGVVTAVGNLVALGSQTNATQNGVYVVGGTATAWTLTRAPGFATYFDLRNHPFYIGGAGATNQWGIFQATAPAGGTLGTTAITVVRNNAASNPLGGMWLTQDGGDTWTRTITGLIDNGGSADNRQFWQGQFSSIPGFSGEWLWTGHSDGGPDRLMWITNDGASRVDIRSNVRDVGYFNFGAVWPGQTRPSVIFNGKVNGVNGAYFSYDWFATNPILIATEVQESVNAPDQVALSRDKFGTALVSSSGMPGSVFYYGVHGKGRSA